MDTIDAETKRHILEYLFDNDRDLASLIVTNKGFYSAASMPSFWIRRLEKDDTKELITKRPDLFRGPLDYFKVYTDDGNWGEQDLPVMGDFVAFEKLKDVREWIDVRNVLTAVTDWIFVGWAYLSVVGGPEGIFDDPYLPRICNKGSCDIAITLSSDTYDDWVYQVRDGEDGFAFELGRVQIMGILIHLVATYPEYVGWVGRSLEFCKDKIIKTRPLFNIKQL